MTESILEGAQLFPSSEYELNPSHLRSKKTKTKLNRMTFFDTDAPPVICGLFATKIPEGGVVVVG